MFKGEQIQTFIEYFFLIILLLVHSFSQETICRFTVLYIEYGIIIYYYYKSVRIVLSVYEHLNIVLASFFTFKYHPQSS